ncbi:hypothetical protein DRN45_04945, partial [Thermococci archaeon]
RTPVAFASSHAILNTVPFSIPRTISCIITDSIIICIYKSSALTIPRTISCIITDSIIICIYKSSALTIREDKSCCQY